MNFRNEDGYGKNSRILHTAEISEKSEVGSRASTRKGDRVPLEHDEGNLERVRLGRKALTIGRYQPFTVGLLRGRAVARFRTLKRSNVRSIWTLQGRGAGQSKRFLIVAKQLLRHNCVQKALPCAFRQPEKSPLSLLRANS